MTAGAIDGPASLSEISVGRLGFTDVSAVVGGFLWVVAIVITDLGSIEQALSLAPLVVVPLGMGMATTPLFSGTARYFYAAAVLSQPVGATVVLLSLVLPSDSIVPAVAATPWIFVTGLLALTALARTRHRGLWPLSETLIDAGFAYSVVGAVALLFHHLNVTFWFDPVIVFLTSIHFHFAGFVLPVLTGLAGRVLGERAGTGFRAVAVVVLFGPAAIAVGISFSPLVEVTAVGGFTVAVAILGGYIAIWVAPERPFVQRVLVTVSALLLPVSMVLALAYGVGTFTGIAPLGVGIATMVDLHGSLNAYGFALAGTLGWRLAVPRANET